MARRLVWLQFSFAISLALLAAGICASTLIYWSVYAEIDHKQNATVHETERRLLGASQALSEHIDSTFASIDVARANDSTT